MNGCDECDRCKLGRQEAGEERDARNLSERQGGREGCDDSLLSSRRWRPRGGGTTRPARRTEAYLARGWCVVVAAKPLLAALVPGGVALLAAGGLAYPVGVVFYGWRGLPYAHAIRHGFVLAGSALPFAAVLLYVARA